MNKQQPEAGLPTERFFTVVYKLTDANTAKYLSNRDWVTYVYADSMAELLRQHAENETLRAGYAAARLEIESLKARLHAAKQINAAQADSVQEDAALWHWLAEYLVGTRTDLDDEIVASETVNDLRKLVEAARGVKGANHDR